MGTHPIFKGGLFPRNSATWRGFPIFMGVPLRWSLTGRSFERIIGLYQSVEKPACLWGWACGGGPTRQLFRRGWGSKLRLKCLRFKQVVQVTLPDLQSRAQGRGRFRLPRRQPLQAASWRAALSLAGAVEKRGGLEVTAVAVELEPMAKPSA